MKQLIVIALLFFSLIGYSQKRSLAWKLTAQPDTTPAPPAPPPRCSSCLIINETWEGTMPPSGLNGYTYPSGGGCCSYSHVRRTDTVAEYGIGALKTELRIGDSLIGNSKRSELNRSSTSEPAPPLNRWYGISFFFPSSWASDVAPEIISQWHEVSSTASPHFALWTKGDHFWIAYDGVAAVDLGAITKNTWYDFDFNIYWSTGSDGNFNVWMNDSHVITDKTGFNMPNDPHCPYWKFGIYKWPWKPGNEGYGSTTTKREYFIDEVRMGNSSATRTDVHAGNY